MLAGVAGNGTSAEPVGCHVAPLSILLNVPAPGVPANIVVWIIGSMTRERMLEFVSPLFDEAQWAPPSALLNKPPVVPAQTVAFVGSMAMVWTNSPPSPVFIENHKVPPFTLLKMPPPFVPAYTVPGADGSMNNERMFKIVMPLVAAF